MLQFGTDTVFLKIFGGRISRWFPVLSCWFPQYSFSIQYNVYTCTYTCTYIHMYIGTRVRTRVLQYTRVRTGTYCYNQGCMKIGSYFHTPLLQYCNSYGHRSTILSRNIVCSSMLPVLKYSNTYQYWVLPVLSTGRERATQKYIAILQYCNIQFMTRVLLLNTIQYWHAILIFAYRYCNILLSFYLFSFFFWHFFFLFSFFFLLFAFCFFLF